MAADYQGFVDECVQQISSIVRNLRDSDANSDALENAENRLTAILRNSRRVAGVFEPCRAMCARIEDILATIEDQKQHIRPLIAVPSTEASTGGRPKYRITREQLEFFVERGFTTQDMASLLHVSLSVVKRRLRAFGISIRASYSQLSDADLDAKVREITADNPHLGQRIVQGSLQAAGIRVQRHRVAESLIRVDEAAVAIRWANTIRRRTYNVATPNALWHIDGNHKLIRWNFVIHGGIDGYSRLCCFMRVADNNRSQSMEAAFLDGVSVYGTPSRVRCDHGLENIGVATLMLAARGTGRGSIITGRSVHNVRIERLWRDLFSSCTGVFHRLFNHLEMSGELSIDDPVHMWALHYVFYERIQKALDVFKQAWNHHRLSTEGGKTPEQLFVQGTLRHSGQGHRGVDDLFRQIPEDNPDPGDIDQYGIDEESIQQADHREASAEVTDMQLFPCPLDQNQLADLQTRMGATHAAGSGEDLFILVKNFCENV